ncbi:cytochrome P450 [Dendrothele bispora CBS 962.96]|uniref:Cytochrome P450 n=1 Tax=Dendrothele bispora (strain CBS 962.96) TaxID=1314807 RepID=A0A4S8L8G5_DENBC|nr:cytochrome P450 [Dendrothele bispora CBS 962.96]
MFSRSKYPAPLPPGPRGLPVVGNVLDMPSEKEWLTFAEWGRKYGGICSVTLMGQTMVIVNSAEIMEALDRKGSVYSDRPRLEMGGELVGYSKTLVLVPYGNRFRNYRRHVSKLIGSNTAMARFHPMEEYETHKFLKRVLANPSGEELGQNLRKLSGSIIMKLAYGIEVQEKNDPFVELIEQANDNFSLATKPGAFLVDVFPSLRNIPAGFPGGGFHALAAKWAKGFNDMVEVPYSYAKQMIANGTAPVSFVSTSLEQEDKLTPEEVFEIKHVAASIYGAGADTTVSAQHAFFLAMVRHPEVMKKAQAEIDAVVGTDRLPNFQDRDRLPYVNAVVTEALRWNSVAPTGVPHRAMEDGVIGNYFIPKNSIIVANLWNMLNDPEVYPDPFKFDPSRHISTDSKPAQRDPRHACFGFARRICVGMQLAEASLWICIANVLAVFDVLPVMDENGRLVIPEHELTGGTISHPKTFQCDIKPRSEKAVSLISAELSG